MSSKLYFSSRRHIVSCGGTVQSQCREGENDLICFVLLLNIVLSLFLTVYCFIIIIYFYSFIFEADNTVFGLPFLSDFLLLFFYPGQIFCTPLFSNSLQLLILKSLSLTPSFPLLTHNHQVFQPLSLSDRS